MRQGEMHSLVAIANAAATRAGQVEASEEAAFNREFEAWTQAIEQIVDLPPRTIDDAAAKAAAIMEWIGTEMDNPADFQDRAAFTVLRELVALLERPASRASLN